MGFNSGDTQNNYAARGLCSTGKLKWSVIMWESFLQGIVSIWIWTHKEKKFVS